MDEEQNKQEGSYYLSPEYRMQMLKEDIQTFTAQVTFEMRGQLTALIGNLMILQQDKSLLEQSYSFASSERKLRDFVEEQIVRLNRIFELQALIREYGSKHPSDK